MCLGQTSSWLPSEVGLIGLIGVKVLSFVGGGGGGGGGLSAGRMVY